MKHFTTSLILIHTSQNYWIELIIPLGKRLKIVKEYSYINYLLYYILYKPQNKLNLKCKNHNADEDERVYSVSNFNFIIYIWYYTTILLFYFVYYICHRWNSITLTYKITNAIHYSTYLTYIIYYCYNNTKIKFACISISILFPCVLNKMMCTSIYIFILLCAFRLTYIIRILTNYNSWSWKKYLN